MNLTTVDSIIQKAESEGLFPGAALGIYLKGAPFITRYHGRHTFVPWSRPVDRDSLFDLASLTKPLATALAVALLMERGQLELKHNLGDFWDGLPPDKAQITVENLLTHTSGLAAWMAIYERLPAKKGRERGSRLDEACRIILGEPLCSKPGKAALYSDLGFMLLGRVVELVSQKGLWSLVKEEIYSPLGLSKISVAQENPSNRQVFVPSGYCPIRNRVSWGEVNDLNAWAIGELPGHAGLFSNLEDVLSLVSAISEAYSWDKDSDFPIDFSTIRHFLSFRSEIEGNNWALGFDRPAPRDSTCGRFFSKRSVGHLGYTGTSFWIDLEAGLCVVFLCARTFPFDSPGSRKKMKAFRRLLHDEVRRALAI